MRKVLFFMLTTLDGFFEGPNQDISWHNVDEEFNDFATEQLAQGGRAAVWARDLRGHGQLLAHARGHRQRPGRGGRDERHAQDRVLTHAGQGRLDQFAADQGQCGRRSCCSSSSSPART